MVCLRCGYCCMNLLVPIVDDPKKGITKDNIIMNEGRGERCKHLLGDKRGDYSCAIHNEPWYQDTPCFSHGQTERDPNTPCRIGAYKINSTNNGVYDAKE